MRELVKLLDNDPTDIRAQNSFSRNLIDGLIEFAAFCKHPAFCEEGEWRVVYVQSTDPEPLDLHFRDSRGVLIS